MESGNSPIHAKIKRLPTHFVLETFVQLWQFFTKKNENDFPKQVSFSEKNFTISWEYSCFFGNYFTHKKFPH